MPPNEIFEDRWIAENVPQPPPDHWRLFHLTTAEFGISDIALGRLKVARFSDLNDPFELMLRYIKRYEHIVSNLKDVYNREKGCFASAQIGESPFCGVTMPISTAGCVLVSMYRRLLRKRSSTKKSV